MKIYNLTSVELVPGEPGTIRTTITPQAAAVKPLKPALENEPFEILRHSTDSQGCPIVDVRGTYLSNKDACTLRDELNRLLPDEDRDTLEQLCAVAARRIAMLEAERDELRAACLRA